MKSSDIIEHIGHILIKYPELLSVNDNILKKYGIDFRNCVPGDGINLLGDFNLEEKISFVIDNGYFDEIKNDKSLALDILLKKIRTINFKKNISNSLIKESL